MDKIDDLNRWLDYVDMSESEFDGADHFRDQGSGSGVGKDGRRQN